MAEHLIDSIRAEKDIDWRLMSRAVELRARVPKNLKFRGERREERLRPATFEMGIVL